ncbi:MAG: P-II family nitrogen regulator [Methanomicrobiales archaeon]|nr:P-II family nitrogen regulator [Methanomicrobiales archaeon]
MKTLKLVRALFPPDKITIITAALEENGFSRMTLTPVEGSVKQPSFSFFACTGFSKSSLLPWLQLEMVVDYFRVDDLIDTLRNTCQIWGIDADIQIIRVEKC